MSVDEGEKPDLPVRKVPYNPRVVAVATELMGVGLLIIGALWLAKNDLLSRLLQALGLSPPFLLLVVTASILGTLGGFVLFRLGQRGSAAVFEQYPALKGQRWQRLQAQFQRWGSAFLLLSAVPGLGTILPPAAGAFGITEIAFVCWSFVGKLLRNYIALVLFGHAFRWISG